MRCGSRVLGACNHLRNGATKATPTRRAADPSAAGCQRSQTPERTSCFHLARWWTPWTGCRDDSRFRSQYTGARDRVQWISGLSAWVSPSETLDWPATGRSVRTASKRVGQTFESLWAPCCLRMPATQPCFSRRSCSPRQRASAFVMCPDYFPVFLDVVALTAVATDLTGFTVAETFDATTIVLVAAFDVTIVTPADDAFD